MTKSLNHKEEALIQIYDDVLDDSDCIEIEKMFAIDNAKKLGITPTGVHVSIKNSIDLLLGNQPAWQQKKKVIIDAVKNCLYQYCFENISTIFAYFPVMKTKLDGERELINVETIRSDRKQVQSAADKIYSITSPNLQYYEKDIGGYHAWHCEHSPLSEKTLKRAMFWILYLNESFENGETEFYHQDIQIKPKRGRLLIAPCSFSHAHRGGKPKMGNKLIATGWYVFK